MDPQTPPNAIDRSRSLLVPVLGLALGACAGTLPGAPVAEEELCGEIARVVCEADRSCFPDLAAREVEACVEAQRAACDEVVLSLALDPRLGYDAVRAGSFVSALEARAATCWSAPPDYDRFLDVFSGTGRTGADCTPARMDDASLRASALSCSGGGACRIHLRADGSAEGVCEPRTDSACSHAFDCGAGAYCALPASWQPGVWGDCRPLRAEGWACSSDLECRSRHCAGTCTDRPELERPLFVTYAALVEGDAPLAFLRFERTTGRYLDATGHGHAGQVVGAATHGREGAIAGDETGALSLPGDGAYVVVGGMDALAEAEALSLEVWFRRADVTASAPILELADGTDVGAHLWNHARGDQLYANLVDEERGGHTIMSAEGVVRAETWHHAVLTHDGTTGRLFLDGARVGEVAADMPLRLAGQLFVGHRAAAGEDPAHFFAGQIDELAVYDHALDAETIRAHHAAGRDGGRANPFPLFTWLER